MSETDSSESPSLADRTSSLFLSSTTFDRFAVPTATASPRRPLVVRTAFDRNEEEEEEEDSIMAMTSVATNTTTSTTNVYSSNLISTTAATINNRRSNINSNSNSNSSMANISRRAKRDRRSFCESSSSGSSSSSSGSLGGSSGGGGIYRSGRRSADPILGAATISAVHRGILAGYMYMEEEGANGDDDDDENDDEDLGDGGNLTSRKCAADCLDDDDDGNEEDGDNNNNNGATIRTISLLEDADENSSNSNSIDIGMIDFAQELQKQQKQQQQQQQQQNPRRGSLLASRRAIHCGLSLNIPSASTITSARRSFTWSYNGDGSASSSSPSPSPSPSPCLSDDGGAGAFEFVPDSAESSSSSSKSPSSAFRRFSRKPSLSSSRSRRMSSQFNNVLAAAGSMSPVANQLSEFSLTSPLRPLEFALPSPVATTTPSSSSSNNNNNKTPMRPSNLFSLMSPAEGGEFGGNSSDSSNNNNNNEGGELDNNKENEVPDFLSRLSTPIKSPYGKTFRPLVISNNSPPASPSMIPAPVQCTSPTLSSSSATRGFNSSSSSSNNNNNNRRTRRVGSVSGLPPLRPRSLSTYISSSSSYHRSVSACSDSSESSIANYFLDRDSRDELASPYPPAPPPDVLNLDSDNNNNNTFMLRTSPADAATATTILEAARRGAAGGGGGSSSGIDASGSKALNVPNNLLEDASTTTTTTTSAAAAAAGGAEGGNAPEELGDGLTNLLLPRLEKPYKDECVCVSSETIAALLDGAYNDKLSSVGAQYYIIDCRYPYEFEGGHIRTAINIHSPEQLEEFFMREIKKNAVIIFHCEFSQKRGPALYKHLRNLDRNHHALEYPKLFYPNMYLLDRGYNQFFKTHSQYCEPNAYVPMRDPRFAAECREMTARQDRTKRERRSRAASMSLLAGFSHYDDMRRSI